MYDCSYDGAQYSALERRGDMIKVTVIPSKDPPEVVQKRREEAVRRFFLAIEKEKAPTADQSKSAQ